VIALAVAGSYLAILAVKRTLALRYAERHRGARAKPTSLSATMVQPISSATMAQLILGARAAQPMLSATIVQPILSGDPMLEPTLARNVELLAGTAFVWLVDADDLLAQEACAAIRRRNPSRDITVLQCPSAPANVNPKLFKLELARAEVRTEAFVVVDDDTVVGPQALEALLAALDSYALATGLPCYESGSGAPSRLVAEFVNDNSSLTYLTICSLMRPMTVNGMCYALRCATLANIGGFAPLLRSLTDDVAIARAVLRSGGTIFQSPYPHETRTTVAGWRAYVLLMQRWFLFARLLLASEPLPVVAIVAVFFVLPPLLLWSILVLAVAAPSPVSAGSAALVLLVRGLLLIDVRRRTLGRARHVWFLSIVSELLQPLHALHAACSRTIRWRSRRFRVRDIDDFSLVP
jgi:ceramide glucosyltransferase